MRYLNGFYAKVNDGYIQLPPIPESEWIEERVEELCEAGMDEDEAWDVAQAEADEHCGSVNPTSFPI